MSLSYTEPVEQFNPHSDPRPGWDPQPADRILLAGDEAALDTMALILATMPEQTRGQVFAEVGTPAEVGELAAPGRVTVTWLVRERGQSLRAALDAWMSEMILDTDEGCSSVYAWIAADGPARLITSE